MRRLIAPVIALALAVFMLTGCMDDQGNGQTSENKVRQSNYDKMVKAQPSHTMNYSPTRDTKNFWIDTWGEKGKLAYIYLMNANGQVFGYFITVGLPVSYCTSLVPPQKVLEDSDGGNVVVQAPSIDGTYSSSSNCSEFYGKDAVSGAYVEYSVGMGINALIYDQPMPQYGDAKPLGEATVKSAAK